MEKQDFEKHLDEIVLYSSVHEDDLYEMASKFIGKKILGSDGKISSDVDKLADDMISNSIKHIMDNYLKADNLSAEAKEKMEEVLFDYVPSKQRILEFFEQYGENDGKITRKLLNAYLENVHMQKVRGKISNNKMNLLGKVDLEKKKEILHHLYTKMGEESLAKKVAKLLDHEVDSHYREVAIPNYVKKKEQEYISRYMK